MNGDDTTNNPETESHDWTRFDAMTDAERHAAALADPDAQPLTDADKDRMTRVPRVTTLRRRFRLTLEAFSEQFRIPLDVLEDWESGRTTPDPAARAYLQVIACAPDTVRAAFAPIAKAAE